jgi:hypothetical protein
VEGSAPCGIPSLAGRALVVCSRWWNATAGAYLSLSTHPQTGDKARLGAVSRGPGTWAGDTTRIQPPSQFEAIAAPLDAARVADPKIAVMDFAKTPSVEQDSMGSDERDGPHPPTNPSDWEPAALPLKLKVGTTFFGVRNPSVQKIFISIRLFS